MCGCGGEGGGDEDVAVVCFIMLFKIMLQGCREPPALHLKKPEIWNGLQSTSVLRFKELEAVSNKCVLQSFSKINKNSRFWISNKRRKYRLLTTWMRETYFQNTQGLNAIDYISAPVTEAATAAARVDFRLSDVNQQPPDHRPKLPTRSREHI